MSLGKKLEKILNNHCAENESDTPDFILAEYLLDCLAAFDKATNRRTKWYSPNVDDFSNSIKVIPYPVAEDQIVIPTKKSKL